MSLKKNLKEKIIYTVLSAVFLMAGIFFDVVPSFFSKYINSKDSSLTTSLNTFEETNKENLLQEEIKALHVHKEKLLSKSTFCENAISTLEEKMHSENFSVGDKSMDMKEGKDLMEKLKVRQIDLQRKIVFVDNLIKNKQDMLVKININKELLAEDMIDVEIQKLEIEELEKEKAKIQEKIQQKQEVIYQKLSTSDIEQIDEEKTQIDDLINDLNQ